MKKWFTNYRGTLIFSFVCLSVILLSIGYSALNTELSISGDAHVRTTNEIRVSSLEMQEAITGGYETFNSRFTDNTSSIFATLPNSSSMITYQAQITNYSSQTYLLKSIQETLNSNSQIQYTITGIRAGDMIMAGETVTYTIQVAYKGEVPSDHTLSLQLQYEFEKFTASSYAYNYTGGVQVFTAPANGTYQLEVWGAAGGSAKAIEAEPALRGGYGGYSIGTKKLNIGDKIYIVVGGAGTSSNQAAFLATGGYNGGGTGLINTTVNHVYGGGGGATSITTTNRGVLANFEAYRSEVLIVAGGGGGGRDQSNHSDRARWGTGGSGGGYKGSQGIYNNDTTVSNVPGDSSGTQTTGYAFGTGESNTSNAGGGGGWYGGYGGAGIRNGVYDRTYYYGFGGGGSGYIGGVGSAYGVTRAMYCYDTLYTSTEDATRTYKTTTVNATATSKAAKSGNGYAKISLLGK